MPVNTYEGMFLLDSTKAAASWDDAVNIGLGRGHSVSEILSMLLDLDGYRNARIIYDKSKPTMIPIRLVDTSKAERVLGFKAKIGLRDGLRRTLEWYRKSR